MKKKMHNFFNMFTFSSWASFTIHKKVSWNLFKHIFFMKITAWTKQTPRTIPKLVTHTTLHKENRLIPKNQIFLKTQLHIHLWSKCPKKTIFLVQCYFSNPSIWKPTAPAFQNTLTFAQYLFNSRSNMRVNLVHWNSLHSKKAILRTFSGQAPHFLGENHKTIT